MSREELTRACMRHNEGKAFFTSTGARLFVGKDGSFTIDTGTVPFIDLPKNTFKFCPWCGAELKEKRYETD